MQKLIKTTSDIAWTPGNKNPSVTLSKPLRPLTSKQKVFTTAMIKNPKLSATAAAKLAYNVSSENSASQIATENLRKPSILAELHKHSANSELSLIRVMQYSTEYGDNGTRDGASHASNAIQAANSILDRLHGKATTRVEQTSTVVTLNIDLTGVTDTDSSI
jgi:phage terminase small subunit